MKKEILIAIIAGIFILGGSILSSPHWFKYFFPDQYLEQEKIKPTETPIKNDNSNDSLNNSNADKELKKNGTENLVISRIELSPKDFKLPSYFYIEIENKGSRIIKNLEIIIDLGKAKYQEFDYSRSVGMTSIIDSNDKSFIKFEVPYIKENQTIEFYSLQSMPIFKSISMNASNMAFDKIYTYEEFVKSEEGENTESSGFDSFLTAMLSLVIIVFTIYFVIVLITFLNKLFKL